MDSDVACGLIKIEGFDIALVMRYGAPDEVLSWLTEFYAGFYKERSGGEVYYAEPCLAQLIRSSVFLQEKYRLSRDKIGGLAVVSIAEYSGHGQHYEYSLLRDGRIDVEVKESACESLATAQDDY